MGSCAHSVRAGSSRTFSQPGDNGVTGITLRGTTVVGDGSWFIDNRLAYLQVRSTVTGKVPAASGQSRPASSARSRSPLAVA